MDSTSNTSLRLTATTSAALLFILTQGPATLRDPLVRILTKRTSEARVIRTLKWTLGFTAWVGTNKLLSAWARNNWLLASNQKQWDWPNEVAVVTGGSGGIGELIVKGLVAKGVKVAVLDVQPLPEALAKCMSDVGPCPPCLSEKANSV
jgi:all-trans-retinol dehydrogenase (NAD+)